MNILLIPNTDWIRNPVPGMRHEKIFEILGKKHKVYVLQFDIYRNRDITYIPKRTKIIRPYSIPVSNVACFYILNLPFQVIKIASVLARLNIDVIVISNLAIGVLTAIIAKFFRIKTIFDLTDYFPESATLYLSQSKSFVRLGLYFLIKMITERNIILSDVSIAVSLPLLAYVKEISPKKKVQWIPNGVDIEKFMPMRPNLRLKKSLQLGDNVLIFVGSIEKWLDLDLVIEAMAKLREDQIDVQLLIIGRSIMTNYYQMILSLIKKYNLKDQVKMIGYIPYKKLPQYINLAIAGIIPFKTDNLLTQMAFPNKLLEYLACGIPVLSSPHIEIQRVGKEYVKIYNTREEFVQHVKILLNSSYDAKRIRERVLTFDWKDIAKKLENILDESI